MKLASGNQETPYATDSTWNRRGLLQPGEDKIVADRLAHILREHSA